jgi:hypothetical protein
MGGIFLSQFHLSPSPPDLNFLIESNKISGNRRRIWWGFYTLFLRQFQLFECSFKIFGNEINGNNAEGDVGGASISLDRCINGSLEVVNNLIAANWGFEGTGGMMLYSNQTSPTVNILNNTITGNDGYGLVATSAGSSSNIDNFSLNLTNTIINGNQPKAERMKLTSQTAITESWF